MATAEMTPYEHEPDGIRTGNEGGMAWEPTAPRYELPDLGGLRIVTGAVEYNPPTGHEPGASAADLTPDNRNALQLAADMALGEDIEIEYTPAGQAEPGEPVPSPAATADSTGWEAIGARSTDATAEWLTQITVELDTAIKKCINHVLGGFSPSLEMHEDARAETYLSIVRHVRKHGVGGFPEDPVNRRYYIMCIANRRAYDQIRRMYALKRSAVVSNDLPEVQYEVEEVVNRLSREAVSEAAATDTAEVVVEELADLWEVVLAQLPEKQSMLLRQKYFEDKSYDEIGTLYQRTNGAMRVAIHRARQSAAKIYAGLVQEAGMEATTTPEEYILMLHKQRDQLKAAPDD